MNKTELTNQVAEKAGISKADAKNAVDAVFEAVKEAMAAEEKVQIIGFGTFFVKEQPARQGVNPSNGAKIEIAAKKVAKFKPGAELAEIVNK